MLSTLRPGLQPADLRVVMALWFDNLFKSYIGPHDPKRAALFRDGSRLRELVELHKKIGRHFSVAKELKPKLEAARAALRTFERESRRDASHVLWSLLRPQLPLFGLSCALMTFDSLVGALNYHMTARILDGVADGSVTLDEVRNDVVVMFVKFTLCIGAHLGAWCLTHKVTGRFTLAVKDEVMRGILSSSASSSLKDWCS